MIRKLVAAICFRLTYGAINQPSRCIAGDLGFRIAKLRLAAGDVVVIKVDRAITMEQAKQIKALVADVLTPSVRALVLDDKMELSVLTRAEIEARAS